MLSKVKFGGKETVVDVRRRYMRFNKAALFNQSGLPNVVNKIRFNLFSDRSVVGTLAKEVRLTANPIMDSYSWAGDITEGGDGRFTIAGGSEGLAASLYFSYTEQYDIGCEPEDNWICTIQQSDFSKAKNRIIHSRGWKKSHEKQ
jgi:hypothetical protein